MDGQRVRGAAQVCITLAIGCILGINAITEEALEGDTLLASGSPDVKTQLQERMKQVTELHAQATMVRKERTVERQKKAQTSIEYMEGYNSKRNDLEKKKAKLRAEMAADQQMVLKTAPADEKESELRKKHDKRIKETMKRALGAMRKVDNLVRGHQREDPTVKAARKNVIKARGSEIFTVLGLDQNQLTKDYLLTMDAAVAAYNSMPDAHNEEKMEKALEVTKERVQKEKIIEMKAKKEVKAKKQRTDANKAYYRQKWVEKRRELDKKKVARDKYVAKLKSEHKFKLWVQEQRENESEHKKGVFDKESDKKIKIEKDHKAFRQKVAKANAKLKENAEKKFSAEQKTWQDKLTSAINEYTRTKNQAWTATEARQKTRTKMTTIRLNSEKAKTESDQAAKDQGYADEMKTKFASESNQKAAQDKKAVADAAKKTSEEAGFKLQEVTSVMEERDSKMSEAKIQKAEALKKKLLAEEKTAMHAAKKEEQINKAMPPPPEVADVTLDKGINNVDADFLMRRQMKEMGKTMPPKIANNKAADPVLSSASAQVQQGAGLPNPRPAETSEAEKEAQDMAQSANP